MELIDTHCHLDLARFSDNLTEIVVRAKAAGVTRFVLPGVYHAGWDRLMSLCNENEGFFAAPGLHPMYLSHHNPHDLEVLAGLAGRGGLTAIGEIGLDYYKEHLDREIQQQLFEQQLEIGKRVQLPVLLHARKAHDQVLATLRRKKFSHGGIVHAFNGSYQQACHYIKLGFGIGIGGTITYDRALKIRKIASELPQQSLVLETDSPDIPVASHKGEDNFPEYLPEILSSLATLRNEETEITANYTSANSKRILGLPS